MADTLTTTTQVDPGVANWYDRILLRRAIPQLIHTLFADKKPLPSKSSDTIKFRRYGALTPATTPINEGTPPPGQQLAKTDLTASVSQYGDYVHITDKISLIVEDAVLSETHALLGEQMGRTVDQLTRDILAACASSTNASSGTNGETPTEITKTDIYAVVRTLKSNDASLFTEVLKASTGVGTVPIRPAYWGLINTHLENDLEAVSGFKNVAEYPSMNGVQVAEFGATGQVRWVSSSVAHQNTTASPDTFKCTILGKHAYAVTNLEAGNVSSIVKDFGSAGTSDPLDQKASAGWKLMFVARILNDNFLHVLNVTSSNKVDS